MVLSELPFSINTGACDPAKIGMKLMESIPIENQCVAQLIDANLDRAREGLRVVEDWCRFGLKNKEFLLVIKDWRQELGKHHLDIYKSARCVEKDLGIGIKHPAQKGRESPEDIVKANCARAQEALRVIEEFARNLDPGLSSAASKIRYELYKLEVQILSEISSNKRKEILQNCKLCLITKPKENLIDIVSNALTAGVTMVQYRCKEGNDLSKFIEAHELALLCQKHKALFIINDRVDLALAVNADGVHLGQEDLPTKEARRLLGQERLIGRSTHSIMDIYKAEEEGCDYLGVGPIYPTQTKPGIETKGLNYIKESSNATCLPWFAIGGINSENLNEVIKNGATRIAIVSSIMNNNDPAKASRNFLKALG